MLTQQLYPMWYVPLLMRRESMHNCRLHKATNSSDGWCRRSKCNTAASSSRESSRGTVGGGWHALMVTPLSSTQQPTATIPCAVDCAACCTCRECLTMCCVCVKWARRGVGRACKACNACVVGHTCTGKTPCAARIHLAMAL